MLPCPAVTRLLALDDTLDYYHSTLLSLDYYRPSQRDDRCAAANDIVADRFEHREHLSKPQKFLGVTTLD